MAPHPKTYSTSIRTIKQSLVYNDRHTRSNLQRQKRRHESLQGRFANEWLHYITFYFQMFTVISQSFTGTSRCWYWATYAWRSNSWRWRFYWCFQQRLIDKWNAKVNGTRSSHFRHGKSTPGSFTTTCQRSATGFNCCNRPVRLCESNQQCYVLPLPFQRGSRRQS